MTPTLTLVFLALIQLIYFIIFAMVLYGSWTFLGLAASFFTKVRLPEKLLDDVWFLLAWPFTVPCKKFKCCLCE